MLCIPHQVIGSEDSHRPLRVTALDRQSCQPHHGCRPPRERLDDVIFLRDRRDLFP